MTTETRENRVKRLYMRSWRRGIKEMDLVLGRYSDDKLSGMDDAELDLYEALLAEMDQDLLRWITGLDPVPEQYTELFQRISDHAKSQGTAK
ncbi:succinate dehydrogenase assembly factor 2 [Aliiruegeria sabulilitoris]|uniref:succinate dehydrogenase assembly factor 2 n=1 Tax=Aliiruegeria sabulilitoris TaxID=1510458 RepID=UPI00082C97B9|nr:succinate dehydrogenase assembly factor 2 [Aliiruegeria sabulilitoris]NDR56531.1 succinate dehydrogenase assembly factor 2 [Pseudoruegeria sp. M32A2M]